MKFLRTWLSVTQKLPFTLQNSCISYKKWKKYTKAPPSNILKLLELECKQVDHTFKKIYNNFNHPSCFSKSYSKEDINQFVNINKTCIYKICKRLDKRIKPCPFTLVWLTKIKNNFKYSFLGGMDITSLNITIPTECQICFENVNKVIIAKCGHYMCFDCFVKMYDLNGVKGEVHNLILYGDYWRMIKCPFCRINRPFSTCKVWPRLKS